MAPPPTSPDSFKIHAYIPPGAVPSLDAALVAYSYRLGTPGTAAVAADPTAVPPVVAQAATPPTAGTLTEVDEEGVVIKVAHQEQGYAQTTLLRGLFEMLAPDMTPVPPNPEPQPPAADGSTPAPKVAAAPTWGGAS